MLRRSKAFGHRRGTRAPLRIQKLTTTEKKLRIADSRLWLANERTNETTRRSVDKIANVVEQNTERSVCDRYKPTDDETRTNWKASQKLPTEPQRCSGGRSRFTAGFSSTTTTTTAPPVARFSRDQSRICSDGEWRR